MSWPRVTDLFNESRTVLMRSPAYIDARGPAPRPRARRIARPGEAAQHRRQMVAAATMVSRHRPKGYSNPISDPGEAP
jgi:hypothetical protein